MAQIDFSFDSDRMIYALKDSIGEDGILWRLWNNHVPGSPESKILFEAWGKLIDLKLSKEKYAKKAA